MSRYFTPKQGEQDVATAGTAEALMSSETTCRLVIVQAKAANTNNVYVGDADVASDNLGVYLTAGQSLSISNDGNDAKLDLSEIYVDVDTNGEGVTFLYF